MSEYSLLLAFDVDDPEFVRGFECGRVWVRAQEDDDEFMVTVHLTNAEMMLRISEATEREVSWVELDPEDGSEPMWATATFAAR